MTQACSGIHCIWRLFVLALLILPSFGHSAGRLQHFTIQSPAMGKSAWGFQVYIPPSYDTTTQRFPVIYVLHGGGSDEYGMSFIANSFYEPLLPEIPEAILVFPNGGRDTFYLDDTVIRRQTENPDRHIIKELIPYIDRTYRTIASREGRSIMGFSMGGYGAYHFAFKYPETFGSVAALAAGGPYGPQGLITQYNPAEKPQSLAITKANQLKSQSTIFIAVGGKDLVDYNNEMAWILRGQGLDFTYQILPGVGHDLGALLNTYSLQMFRALLMKVPQQ